MKWVRPLLATSAQRATLALSLRTCYKVHVSSVPILELHWVWRASCVNDGSMQYMNE